MTDLADDPLARVMRKAGMDVTREDYIEMAWGVELPEPWTLEHELELPDELQDFSKVTAREEPEDDEGEEGDEEEATDAAQPPRWKIPKFNPSGG